MAFVGFENELVGYHLVLGQQAGGGWSEAPIGYGDVVARTTGTSRVNNIPYAEIQVEGATGGSNRGTPEHVGGPTRLPLPPAPGATRNRSDSFDVSREALRVLRDTLRQRTSQAPTAANSFTIGGDTYFFLAPILAAYNTAIHGRAGGPGGLPLYDQFRLALSDTPTKRWGIKKRKATQPDATTDRLGTQVNVEVPFRAIGRPGGGANLRDALVARDAAALMEAQTRADQLVNQTMMAMTPPTQYLVGLNFYNATHRRFSRASSQLRAVREAIGWYVSNPSMHQTGLVRDRLYAWMAAHPGEWRARGQPLWDAGLGLELRMACRRRNIHVTQGNQPGENEMLRSLIALYYYALFILNQNAKSTARFRGPGGVDLRGEEHAATNMKDRWGLLPKVRWKDLWDNAIDMHDRLVLRYWTSNPGRWTAIKTTMNNDLDAIETAGAIGANWVLNRDQAHDDAFLTQTFTISSSGKPLPLIARDETKADGSTQRERLIVFEGRGGATVSRDAGAAMNDATPNLQYVEALVAELNQFQV